MSTLNKPLSNKPLSKSSDGTPVAAIETLRAFIHVRMKALNVSMQCGSPRVGFAAQRHHIVMMKPIMMITKPMSRFQAPMFGIG